MDTEAYDFHVLVTGGCGFIGSHLVKRLLARKCKVTVIDDLSSGSTENLDLSSCGLKTLLLQCQDSEAYRSLRSLDIDCVFHLAAQASVPVSVERFGLSSANNLLSSLFALEFCKERNIPVVYASSSAVYGNLSYGVENSAVDLLTPYAGDKYMLELYSQILLELNGLRSFGFRFFNVYGPRQDPSNPYSGVISIFLDRAVKGLPLQIFGGHQTRDFIYVDDVIDYLLAAMRDLTKSGTNPSAEVINLLTGQSTSISTLAKIVCDLVGAKHQFEYLELPPGEPVRSEGSQEKMKILFPDLQPKTSLLAGLEATLEWFRTKD